MPIDAPSRRFGPSCLERLNDMCLIYKAVEKAFSGLFGKRSDGDPRFPYLTAEECGVETSQFSFLSEGRKLNGNRYFVGNGPYKAVIVFFHGYGAGCNAYMQPICDLAKAGYLVYAFDYTGCQTSEGESMIAFEHVLIDMKYFFEWLDKDPSQKGYARYSWGHSWGGYASLMSLEYPQYGIEKCVSISGFNDTKSDLYALLGDKIPSFARTSVDRYMKKRVGELAWKPALPVLKKTNKEVLYIQGDKDPIVVPEVSGLLLKKELADHTNIHFVVAPGRLHQPFLSARSEQYIEDVMEGKYFEDYGPMRLAMDPKKAGERNTEIDSLILDFYEKEKCH